MKYNNPTAVLVYIIHCIAMWYMVGKSPPLTMFGGIYI